MLEIRNLEIKTKNDRELIKDLSLSIAQGDKLAIIGEEGNGKSTLIKAIYDKQLIEEYTNIKGYVISRANVIGYLEQFLDERWNELDINEYFLKEKAEDEVDYEQYNKIYELNKIFSKVNLNTRYIDNGKLIGKLSGGEKVKLQMAKILLKKPDLLLLDEPTNDLDIETLEWLEQFIKNSTIPVIFISHDEILLERASNCILHLEQIKNKTKAKHTYEHIGYREYVDKRIYLIAKQNQMAKNDKREHDKQMEMYNKIYSEVSHDLQNVSRQDPGKGRLLKKKMKSVKVVGKHLEEQELTKRPEVEESIIAKFHNEDDIHNTKVILDLKLEVLKNNDKILSNNINLKIVGKEKICIIGNNGCGKTTLIKQIYDDMKERKDIKVGYMPQNYEEKLDKNISPIEFLKKEYTKEEETAARTYMGSMKFTEEEMKNKIEKLSGGQKAKLFILKIIMEKCNVILLDEPTRNLSPLSVPVILNLLRNFEGAIISISHDRKYIKEVCNKVYKLDKTGLKATEIA